MDIFDVNEITSFQYMNYVRYGNGNGGLHFVKTNGAANAYTALQARTATGNIDNEGVVNYSIDFFQHVVHLDSVAHTRDSASVRISAINPGLRFKSNYTDEYLAYMAAYAEARGEAMEIGTLIAPADYVASVGEFTHAALSAKYSLNPYIEVMANVDNPFSQRNGITTIAGSISNIASANLTRDFAGIGFIKIGNEYFYTDTYTVRNISNIATVALDDTASVQGNGYNYSVSDGIWSPYTKDQRSILNALIAK